jgi:protein-arginine kinase activator protein McsA
MLSMVASGEPHASLSRRCAAITRPSERKYPCEDCRDAVPSEYCNACAAEWEKREHAEFEKRTAKQRADYKRRKQHMLSTRPLRRCQTCGLEFKQTRIDARFCCDTCRQRAHRKAKALVTGKHSARASTITNRDKAAVWEGRILAVLERKQAIFLNDLLPKDRTRAQYQTLCSAAVKLEQAGKIESLSYWARFGKPGFKVLAKVGHKLPDDPDKIPRLKANER